MPPVDRYQLEEDVQPLRLIGFHVLVSIYRSGQPRVDRERNKATKVQVMTRMMVIMMMTMMMSRQDPVTLDYLYDNCRGCPLNVSASVLFLDFLQPYVCCLR